MKLISQYILPGALVSSFLCFFFYDALHYPVNIDDCFYNALLHNYGITKCVSTCYKIVNGRWFSHIVCSFIFHLLGTNFLLYAAYLTFLMLLFVSAVARLYKNCQKTFFRTEIFFAKSMVFGFVFTATLYFLLFEGRKEIWGWISSVNNHLLSVIVCLFLFSLLIKKKQNFSTVFFVIILSAFAGGLNEVNAVCTITLAIGLLFISKNYFHEIRMNAPVIWLSVLSIIVSLSFNIFSGGYKMRMEGLPDFSIGQSLKNTLHTFLLPFMHYQYMPYFLMAFSIYFLFLNKNEIYFVRKFTLSKTEIIVAAYTIMVVSFSFFLHCYTLSDIVPPRGEIWGYNLLLFVIGMHLVKKP